MANGRAEDDAARVARELRRLEGLAARRRMRVRVLRALRGTLGAGATLAALIKLKLAGSLTLKLALAALVGLGLAWPMVALGLFALAAVLLSLVGLILSLFDGGGSPSLDCDCACDRRERRAVRLAELIRKRRHWLEQRAGPVPSPRSEAAGSVRGGPRGGAVRARRPRRSPAPPPA